jgi:pimeloyl-ACP methyl ester carboxylesterase/2-polyprenyl-6-methoxyphenol hydroxylase-like FAD-dependent oxidoreductase
MDSQQTREREIARGEHAVVIGASVAGLLAARVLAEAFENVTVVERDSLPKGDANRRAVPQGHHAHALIAGGQRALEELLPGFRDELIEAGAPTMSRFNDVNILIRGHELPRVALGETTITASRAFIEGHLRRRVLALGNVCLRERCEARGLIAACDRGRVNGVRLRRREGDVAGETLAADLVVAATGRSARVPAWLEELGYGRPKEDVLEVDLTYASRNYRLAPGTLTDQLTLRGTKPVSPRGMALFAQENDLWLLTLAGYGSHRPPTDEAGFTGFLEAVAPPHIVAALGEGEPVDEIATYRFSSNLRRRYERMRRFPDGLLVCGDAVCSFNPLYGQGMTVAALEAAALRAALVGGTPRLRRRYFAATKGIVDHAWQMATGGDLAVPEVEARRSWSWRLSNAYTERLLEAAEEDGDLTAAFARVSAMLARPSHLVRPSIARRVLAGGRDSLLWPGRPLATPVQRRTLRVGSIATPLREAGPSDASEAVVFVHGVPGSGADFEPLLAAAGRLGRAVAWDAPGFGKADKPEGFEQSVEGHAGFLAEALEELGIERAHLVLHDFGGPWGLAWAAGEPERLASATLICTGADLGDRWHRAARIWRTPLAGELVMATLTRGRFRGALRRGNSPRLPAPFVDRMYEDLDRGTRGSILRLYRSVDDRAIRARELSSALRPLDVPALVIWGRHDPYLPHALAARQREAFPGAEVHVLEASGHWPFVDQGDRVEELLVGFLKRALAPRPAAERALDSAV